MGAKFGGLGTNRVWMVLILAIIYALIDFYLNISVLGASRYNR